MALLALGVLASACGNGEDRPGSAGSSASVSGSTTSDAAFKESDADTVVRLTATEYAFAGLPQQVKGKKVYFEVQNDGKEEHELVVVGADGEPFAEAEHIAAGKKQILAVELKPGKWTIACHLEKDGKLHSVLGMEASFTVT